MAQKIGIDLGTTTVLICVNKKGIIVNEPAYVTVDAHSKKSLAVGQEAKEMIGKTPGSMICISPMKDGVIADYEAVDKMLQHFFKKHKLHKTFHKSMIMICCPTNITQVERNAIRDCAYRLGASKVFLEEEPRVAAVGAGLDVAQPIASLVLDIGGGTTDVAIISLGYIVCSASIKTAGNQFNRDIINYVKDYKAMYIGEQSAEKLKIDIGCTKDSKRDVKEMIISGRDCIGGLPKTVTLHSNEIADCLQKSIDEIVHACRRVLDVCPPELASDIMSRGMVLTGGGAMLEGLCETLRKELLIPVVLADDPKQCVVNGCMKMLESLK